VTKTAPARDLEAGALLETYKDSTEAIAEEETPAESPVRLPYKDSIPDSWGAFYTFIMERVPIIVYAELVAGMVLSGVFVGAKKFDSTAFGVGFGIGMLFNVLLRFMDEAKDVEKDKKGHPERPLPRGLVSIDAVTRVIYVMYTALIGACVGCFWLNTAAGVSACVVTVYLWLMYVEFWIPELLDRSPLLVAITHQAIIFPMAVFVCCVANGEAHLQAETYLLGLVLLGSMLTYEVCRKLDPKAHVVLGTYLVAYGPCGVFAMVAFATLMDVGGAVGLALKFNLLWPAVMLGPAPVLVLLSLTLLFLAGNPGKSHKLVEIMSVLSLLFQWYAIPIGFWSNWYRAA